MYSVSADPVSSCGAKKVRSTVLIVYSFLREMTPKISFKGFGSVNSLVLIDQRMTKRICLLISWIIIKPDEPNEREEPEKQEKSGKPRSLPGPVTGSLSPEFFFFTSFYAIFLIKLIMLLQLTKRSKLFFVFLFVVAMVVAFDAQPLYSFGDVGVVVEQLKEADRANTCPYCGRPINTGTIHTDASNIVRERLKTALTDRNVGYSEGKRKGQPYINVLIYRFQERKGGNYSVEKPASVAFHMHLMKDNVVGKVFEYKEDQKALSQNLFTMGKFFQRGGRWVTAEALATEGINAGLDYLLVEPEGAAETQN